MAGYPHSTLLKESRPGPIQPCWRVGGAATRVKVMHGRAELYLTPFGWVQCVEIDAAYAAFGRAVGRHLWGVE